MFYRRLVVMIIIMGFFVFLTGTGCATSRPRVMKNSGTYLAPNAAPVGGSPHLKGGLARVHVSGRLDCIDILIMVLLFTWLFGD